MSRNLSRRDFIKLSGVFAGGVLLAACTPKAQPTATPVPKPVANGGGYPAGFKAKSDSWLRLPADHKKGTLIPQAEWYKILGDPPADAIEGAFWLEGWGMLWKQQVADVMNKEHPGLKWNIWSDPKIWDTLQPRFVAGDVPDIGHVWWQNAPGQVQGAKDGILCPVDILLDLEAYGNPGKRVEEVLADGALQGAVLPAYPDHFYAMPWVQTQVGIYYNAAMFEQHGWPQPDTLTWEDFVVLCNKIKDAGIPPWVVPGKVIGYLDCILWGLVYKKAGCAGELAIDNLKEGAWTNPDVVWAFDQIQSIYKNGWLAPGCEALSHTEVQQLFVDGKAAMVGCGSWLQREMSETTPKGFRMKLSSVPAPKDAKGFPLAVRNSSGEAAIMVGNGKHPLWGLEFLRTMLSPQIGQYVGDVVGGVLSLKDPLKGVKVSDYGQSQSDAVTKAQGAFVDFKYGSLYPTLSKPLDDNKGDWFFGKMKSIDVLNLLERSAKEIRDDASITKVPVTFCK